MGEARVIEGTIERAGEVPPVLFLHSLAMDRTLWDEQVARLRGRRQTIAVDLPGHGRSAPIAEASVEWMADEVARYATDNGVGPAIVVGLSLGGCVAQALAARHPALVAGLLLVDTTAWYGADAPDKWEARAQRAATEGFASLADFQLDRWFSPRFRGEHPDLGDRLLEIFCANDLDSYVATCRAMGAYDGRDLLAAVTVPAAVVVGELDPATPVADARHLAGRLPEATLRIIPEASHLSPVECPDEIAEEIDGLLRRV